ncbi:MAG: sporulation protein [Gracilibacter sp. BRH_c7a]|nr:MAG: sporulation protein [Gracilibacter sp. BRH_c7a]
MFTKLTRYYKGRVYIKAKGDKVSDFINKALQAEIVFFNVKRTPDSFTAEINIEDFSRLRKAAREAEVRIKIRAKYGFPFVAVRWRKRKGLLLGILIVFAALTILSQFILSVSVEGNERVPTEIILTEAEKLGVKQWRFKNQLDLDEVSKQLQENLSDIVWATMEERGTNIRIRVVEKTLPEKVIYKGDLVAAKTGYVEEIIIIQGQPAVKEGQLVEAGQVLIKAAGGMVEYSYDMGDKKDSQENIVNAPAAKGFVRGKVWYSAEKKVLLEEDIVEKTGRTVIGWGIKIRDRVIMITNQNSPYAESDEETQSYKLLSWRNWDFPVEIIKTQYEQKETIHVQRQVAEAREHAENQAREELQKEVPADAKILQDRVRILTNVDGVEILRVEVETFEELAIYRE